MIASFSNATLSLLASPGARSDSAAKFRPHNGLATVSRTDGAITGVRPLPKPRTSTRPEATGAPSGRPSTGESRPVISPTRKVCGDLRPDALHRETSLIVLVFATPKTAPTRSCGARRMGTGRRQAPLTSVRPGNGRSVARCSGTASVSAEADDLAHPSHGEAPRHQGQRQGQPPRPRTLHGPYRGIAFPRWSNTVLRDGQVEHLQGWYVDHIFGNGAQVRWIVSTIALLRPRPSARSRGRPGCCPMAISAGPVAGATDADGHGAEEVRVAGYRIGTRPLFCTEANVRYEPRREPRRVAGPMEIADALQSLRKRNSRLVWPTKTCNSHIKNACNEDQ